MAEPQTGGNAKGKLLALAIVLAGLGGGAAWWTWEDWSARESGEIEREGEREKETQGAEQGVTPTVQIVPVPRIAPTIAPSDGTPVQLGTIPPYADGVRRTITLRHVSGRADPVSMSAPKLSVTQKEGSYTTSPTVVTEEDNCFSASSAPDGNGTYCRFTIAWDPRPDEELRATVRTRVEAYVTQKMRTEAATLADVPGGWEGYDLEIEIVGASAPAPAPAQLRADPPAIRWPEGVAEEARMGVTLLAENRVIETRRIFVFPKTETVEIIDGRHGSCEGKRMVPDAEEPARCTINLQWAPTREQPELDHELVIVWGEPTRENGEGAQEGAERETVVKMTGLTVFADPEKAEPPEIAFEPEEVVFESVESGTRSPRKRVRMTVSRAAAVIEQIAPTPDAGSEGLRTSDTGECIGTHVPGAETSRAWCFFNVEVEAGRRTGEFAKREIEIIWSAGRSTAPGEGIDRYILQLPVSWKVHPAGEEAPERTIAGTLASSQPSVDFGTSEAGRLERRITLRNTTQDKSALTILRVGLESARGEWREGARIDARGCTEIEEGRLKEGQFCDMRITWEATPGAELKASAEIMWETLGRRHRMDIPVAGRVPAPEVEVEPEPTLGEPPAVPEAAPQPETAGPVELARRRARAAMAAPGLAQGTGVVEMDLQRFAEIDPERARRLRILDENLRPIGVEWSESGRPIDLTAVVIENTPIHIVITQRVNAAYGGPVTAMVQKPVWGGHSRARVIERGARVIGYSSGITGLGGTGATRAPGGAARREGGAGERRREGVAGTTTVGGARLDVDWRYLMRPDGAAFGLAGEIATGDLMGAQGLPVILDPYEWERYIGIVGNAGIRALGILASPRKRLVKTVTTTQSGGTVEGFEHIPTQEELAAEEIVKGLREATLVMQALTTPQPAIVLPAGTRGVLSPLRGLVLTPITALPPEEPVVPGSEDAEALAEEIAKSHDAMRTRSPDQDEKEEGEGGARQKGGQDPPPHGGMPEFQRPPEGMYRARDRISTAPGTEPTWRDRAQEQGVLLMEPHEETEREALPAPRREPAQTTGAEPAWTRGAQGG